MAVAGVRTELDRFGPHQASLPISLPSAQRYCRRLARSHYENFAVASLLLPRALRPHFHAIYAYCRWADDLADEIGDPQRSLELLDWWEQQVHQLYQGHTRHPVFVALQPTIRQFRIPPEPLLDLLVAFRKDQRRDRYENVAELLQYCRHSANPVGRLVLYVGESFGAEQAELSDRICTGLQLANFWQDIAADWRRNRVYLPAETLHLHGCEMTCFEAQQATPAFRDALQTEVDRAEELLLSGWPLRAVVSPQLRVEVELFVRGGLEILAAIRRLNYDVWRQRPTLRQGTQVKLLWKAWHARRQSKRAL